MFLLGLIYLIILVAWAIGYPGWADARGRIVGGAQFILFLIIGIVLFYSVLSRG